MDMKNSPLITPTEVNNDINFNVHLNDLPCIGNTRFSISICKSIISKNDMNENCPFCLTAHPFNESDFGESCPVFTQKKEESQSFKQCSHCQGSGDMKITAISTASLMLIPVIYLATVLLKPKVNLLS